MTQGPGRFEYYLLQLDELLIQASKTDNPALYLYKNDARTKAFMLEGLSKLYAGLHNKKKFLYAKKHFKMLEDIIGAIDYYDSFARQFLADPQMLTTIRMFMEEKRDENIATLNALLKEKGWIKSKKSRTNKIRKKIKTAAWLQPDEEIDLIHTFYKDAIEDINTFYIETGNAFTDIENEVHELRRKLRWLSIYPQALQGAVMLVDSAATDDDVKKYLTPEVVNSPYNKLPEPGNNKHFLKLEKNYFLALSFTISALGKLKDEGLQLVATAEAIKATQFVEEEIAYNRASLLNNSSETALIDVMAKARNICDPFFKERNLDKMISVKQD